MTISQINPQNKSFESLTISEIIQDRTSSPNKSPEKSLYSPHHRVGYSLGSKLEKQSQLNCQCSSKHNNSEIFCLKCKLPYCKNCSFSLHENHPTKELLKEISEDNEENYESKKNQLDILINGFSEFKEKLIESMKEAMDIHNKEFVVTYMHIFDLLHKIKEKYDQQAKNDFDNVINQLNLIESSLSALQADVTKLSSDNIHPNKKFQLNQIFDEKMGKNVKIRDFQINTSGNQKLKEISLTLESIRDYHHQPTFLELFGERWNFIVKCSTIKDVSLSPDHEESLKKAKIPPTINICQNLDFITKPTELFKEKPFCLAKGLFHPRFWKSKVSTTFMINDESFLAFAGEKDNKTNNYPLCVYNLTLNKKEDSLYLSDSKISLVSTYPENASLNSKKWLYTADDFGILRIFNLKNGKMFDKINKFECNLGKSIISALIFDDKYNEIDNNNKLYLIITFANANLPISLYRLNSDGTQEEIIQEIANPCNQICFTTSFFHEESIKKTLIFLGFSKSFIKIYDLQSNNWLEQEFETNTDISSINFITQKETNQNLIMFTQWNNIIVLADILTGDIFKKISISVVECIFDLCMWDTKPNYVLIATYNENCIKVLDMTNFKIVGSLQTSSHRPINVSKILIKDASTMKFKECLVSCLYLKDEQNSILLFTK